MNILVKLSMYCVVAKSRKLPRSGLVQRLASAAPLSRTLGALLLGGACHPAKRCGAANFMLSYRAFLHDLAYPHPCADALFSEATRPLTQSATGRRTLDYSF